MEFEAGKGVNFILPSFIFGCYSAVHASSRYTAYLTHVMRRLAAMPAGGYVDDLVVSELPCTRGTGQKALHEMGGYVIGFEKVKVACAHESTDSLSWCAD